MNVLHVARDVVREAFARRFMLGIFGFILLGLIVLSTALDLEVVQGTLAAGRLFGLRLNNPIVPIDVAMRGIFAALAYPVFYLGLVFGVVANSGAAVALLAPGRVEMLLSLPLRRGELVLGIYLGVLAVSAIAVSFAVGGVSLVLFVKVGFVTWAPLAGALMALLGFVPIYAVMLAVTCLLRSPALASGSGLLLLIAGVATSNRQAFVSLFRPGFGQDLASVLITPLPRLHWLATCGAQAAERGAWIDPSVLPAALATLAFAAAFVVLAAFVVAGKDY